jgi:ectoine hydroxylase-related dioxygenase (phytanoyl-CoA dioxygenase family)
MVVDEVIADLDRDGFVVVEDVLRGDELRAVRDAVYAAASEDEAAGRRRQWEGDFDATNQRVWNLPSRGRVFLDLVEHPVALGFVKQLVGWPALLSNISANITGPGGGEMYLHCDQSYMPEPWSGIQGINVIWCLDDFTDENGATRIHPQSHLDPTPPAPEWPTIPMEASAGSIVVMEGRLWHHTGLNRTTDQRRAGVFAWYTPPIYLPQENWWLTLDPDVLDSEELLMLFGWKVGGFGRVFGRSPR